MPLCVFEPSLFGPAVSASAPWGAELRDVCDRHAAPVPFGCRSASCGTCLIEVLEGGELLEPGGIAETFVLDTLRASATHRLACQARLRSQPVGGGGDALVRVRVGKLPPRT